MTGTLTTWRTAVLALLDDASSARFTSAQVDAAIRQALQAYNTRRPLVQTYILDGQDAYQIVMPADFATEHVIGVELDNDDDPPTELPFRAFRRDEQWVVETLNYKVASTESILVTYSTTHTLDGLDSGAGTTIPDLDEYAVMIGAAGFALRSRSVSRSESINLLPEVSENLSQLADAYLTNFEILIRPHPRPTFTAEPELKSDVF
jgi:hypothetical protein